MVKQWMAALLSAGVLAGALGGINATAGAPAPEETKTELKTWYTKPALDGSGEEDWQKEGTPVGNGFLGGMIYGDPASDRIMINEKTVWSGGPGANPNYDGGINHSYTKAEMHENLQKLRKKLQDIVTDFSKNKAAYVDENGNVVSQNYGTWRSYNGDGCWEDEETSALINSLIGDKNNFGSYQMLSNVNIVDGTAGEVSDYVRSLDLRTAVNTITYKKGGVGYQKDYFVNNPSNVMVIRLTADQSGKITRTFKVTTEQGKKTITAEGDTITMVGQPSDQRTNGLHYAQQVKVINQGGTLKVNGDKSITVTGADEVVLLIAAGTDYVQCMDTTYNYFSGEDPLTAVSARITAAAGKGFAALLEEHLTDYDELFGRVDFSLSGVTMPKDKTTAELLAGYKAGTLTEAESRYLELLYYQFGRYLLISSSREGSLPANLQGIWADHLNPPWSADYHTNINLQMNYWLAEQTNLSECHLPVIEYVNSLVPRGSETARYFYCREDGGTVRGWTIGHENNVWGNTAPGNWYWGYYFPAAAAWMCQDIWEYYAFTLDTKFLKDNFDTMLQAALFWVDNLWTDTRDGTLVANPSYSPEHGPYSIGSSCDQEVIWELFEEVRKSAEIIGINSAEVKEVIEAQKKLYLPKIGLAGEYLEWKDETTLDITGDGGHRHVNHLYALHPGTLVVAGRSDEDDENVEAMKKVLITRGDGGTGWSKAWKINFWARLRDGDHAGVMVNQILKESTLDNLFDTHSPFQIDGNFGATAGMTEMLLQSQGDSIDLLAAMPNTWGKGGAVKGLKARGNFTVDMTWADQQLNAASVTSGSGVDCTLNYHSLAKATVKTAAGAPVEVKVVDKDTITFPTEKGVTYVISDIPQDKKFPESVNLLRTNFNNLYNDAMVKAVGLTDDDGAYVESFDLQPAGPKVGLETGDVVRAYNGEPIKTTAELLSKYEATKAYETVTLTVWRGGKTFDTTFRKTELSAKNDDLYHVMAGRVWAGGYKSLFDGAITTRVNDAIAVKGSGGILYYNLNLYDVPTSAKLAAVVNGTGTATIYMDSQGGDEVASFQLTDTKGELKEFSGKLGDMEFFEGFHDFYVVLDGDITMSWFELGNGGDLGDVDGKDGVTTTDARLTLQYAAGKIGEDALNVAVADVDGVAPVSTTDARLILQKAAGKIEKFPVE